MQALTFFYLSAATTSLLCVAIISIAIVRLGLCYKNTRPRIKYTTLILCAAVAGLQPYFANYFPGIGTMALAATLAILLFDGTPAFHFYKDKEQPFDTQIFDPDVHGEDQ